MNTIEPITAIWTNGSGDTAEQIPVAILQAVDSGKVLCVRGDTGELTVVAITLVRTDWRYDPEKSQWIDISVPDDEEVVADGSGADDTI